jgi:hypothetical protein
VPAKQRRRRHDRERFAPGEAAREEAEPIRRPPGLHLPLPVQGQLLAEEQVLRSQGRPRPEAGFQESHEIQREPGYYPARRNPRLYPFMHWSPPSTWNRVLCVESGESARAK